MSWKIEKLGNLCKIEKGRTGIQKAIPGEYPLVVTSEERKTHNEFQFDAEAVIVPLVSSTGHGHKSLKRIHYQKGKFALGSILCAIIPEDSTILNAEFLYRYLDTNKENELVARMKGMANVSLPIKEIAEIEIPLPSLEEQIDLVNKFNSFELSCKINEVELTHQFELVKSLRQAFLREAMQGKLSEAGLPEVPNEQELYRKHGELFYAGGADLLSHIKTEKEKLVKEKKLKKEKPLPPIKPEEVPFPIPHNWTWCRLGEVAFKIDYGTSTRAEDFGEVPVLRMGNITANGTLTYNNLKYISKNNRDLPKLFLENDDLLFNRTNSYELVGKAAVFSFDGLYSFASYLIRVRFSNLTSASFASYYINSNLCRTTQIEPNIIQQNGQANFNGSKLSNIIIPLPPLSEQYRIVSELGSLMQYCDSLEKSISESIELNEKLLQQVLREALQPKEEEVLDVV